MDHTHWATNGMFYTLTASNSSRSRLDVIMDMFQAPTLLQDTLFNTTSHAADDSFEKNCRVNGKSGAPYCLLLQRLRFHLHWLC